MARNEDRFFADESFPILVDVCRVSGIDRVEDARCAIHEAIEIKYFYEGSSTLLLGRETIIANAGDVVVINPYEFHATVDYGTEKGKYHLLMISPDFFPDVTPEVSDFKRRLLSGQISFCPLFRGNSELSHILSRTVEEVQQKKTGYRVAVHGLMLQLLSHLLRTATETVSPDEARAHAARHYGVIEPALRRIRDGFSDHLTVDELSALCSVSKYHFCRVFKSVTDMTVMQYVNDYRLTIADTMLKNTDRTVAEISRLCGFEDESYFCRCYKKRFGHPAGKRR